MCLFLVCRTYTHHTCVHIHNTNILILFLQLTYDRSHSGDIIATGGTAGIVRLWSTTTGSSTGSTTGTSTGSITYMSIANLTGHSAAVTGLSFSPDDRQLSSVGEDGCIFIWNIQY